MILDESYIQNALVNEKLVDIYLSIRVRGETVRSIAARHGVDSSTIHDKYVRACHHIADELKRELARTEYSLGKFRNKDKQDWGNVPANIFYVNGHTHKDTFSIPSIRPFVLGHCNGMVFNAFAGNTTLDRDTCNFVTNDINYGCNTNFHLDCSHEGFVEALAAAGLTTFDTILIDPPFSLYLARRKYNGNWYRSYTRVKNNLDKLAKLGTKVVTLGFNSTGMGKMRGYEKLELLIVNAKGTSNDILCLVERKVQMITLEEDGFDHEELPDG
jgi:hypothetical protein